MSGKVYIAIVDGGGDRPMLELGNLTAFEAANTPNLDHLARHGQQGLVKIIDASICPESDNGAMAILSYNPLHHYTGRGPLEGLGAGFLKLGDVAVSFRINFASYNEQAGRLDRRTSRDLTDTELQELTAAVRERVVLSAFPDVDFRILAFARHRGILCFTSEGTPLNGNVSNTDPGFEKLGAFGIPVPEARRASTPLQCRPLDGTDGARNVASLVNEFVCKSAVVLAEHPVNSRRIANGKLPANVLLVRDGGNQPMPLPPFAEKFGRSVSLYGQIPAEAGLMQLVGGQFTGCTPSQQESEAEFLRRAALALLQDARDVVAIHISKSADEAGHDGNPRGKAEAIELFDRHFLANLLGGMSDDDVCVVTCDHATPCSLRIHSDDPVPTVVFGNGIQPGGSVAFGERFAVAGGLPVRVAHLLLPYIFSQGEH